MREQPPLGFFAFEPQHGAKLHSSSNMTEPKFTQAAHRNASRAQTIRAWRVRVAIAAGTLSVVAALGYATWESAYAAGTGIATTTAGTAATPAAPASTAAAAATNTTIEPDSAGMNPHPVHLLRPAVAPLSGVAQIGKQIFYDTSLSASGTESCASCHDPAHAYGPPNDRALQLGGPHMNLVGHRPPPSLMYLYRQPNFSIGPDDAGSEGTVTIAQTAAAAQAAASAAGIPHPEKTVGAATSAVAMVPQGGMFWDGRADTLQIQAYGPLLNPVEMANHDVKSVAAKLLTRPYAKDLAQYFGSNVLKSPDLLASEAMFAVARYQIEAPDFHPYTSKFDYWLEGRARLTPAEARGYRLFNDQNKANCAGCHLSQPAKDGMPPMFTDYQYEALGAPRNMNIPANHDPKFYDIGICGPDRTDMKTQAPYCSMFLTPTLRNVATRKVFFHNGVFHTLQAVMDFYDYRDTQPGKVYPLGANGKPAKYNDIPKRYLANVDVTDPPFDRKLGEKPAMSEQDMRDIIAFMKTLTDGYKPDMPLTQAAR